MADEKKQPQVSQSDVNDLAAKIFVVAVGNMGHELASVNDPEKWSRMAEACQGAASAFLEKRPKKPDFKISDPV